MTDFIVDMSMEKSLIYLKNRLCDECWNGLSAFIEVAKNQSNSLDHINCPCIKCRNHDMLPVETVRVYVHQFGFDTMYTKWIHHNETIAVSNTKLGVGEWIDEMFVILNDVAGINDEFNN